MAVSAVVFLLSQMADLEELCSISPRYKQLSEKPSTWQEYWVYKATYEEAELFKFSPFRNTKGWDGGSHLLT